MGKNRTSCVQFPSIPCPVFFSSIDYILTHSRGSIIVRESRIWSIVNQFCQANSWFLGIFILNCRGMCVCGWCIFFYLSLLHCAKFFVTFFVFTGFWYKFSRTWFFRSRSIASSSTSNIWCVCVSCTVVVRFSHGGQSYFFRYSSSRSRHCIQIYKKYYKVTLIV